MTRCPFPNIDSPWNGMGTCEILMVRLFPERPSGSKWISMSCSVYIAFRAQVRTSAWYSIGKATKRLRSSRLLNLTSHLALSAAGITNCLLVGPLLSIVSIPSMFACPPLRPYLRRSSFSVPFNVLLVCTSIFSFLSLELPHVDTRFVCSLKQMRYPILLCIV